MDNLSDFFLRKKYENVKKLKSKLEEINSLIDWKEFNKFFPKRESNMGRPPYDNIMMIKILILQNLYGISDEETEYQINDRFSFQAFLGFPKNIPDYSTIWYFRENLLNLGIEDKIFDEFLRQIKSFDYEVKEGKIQDATFIQTPNGKSKPQHEERGRDISKTSRSRDGKWAKKNCKAFFGFKLHTKSERGSKLIESFAVTPANVHDNKIDLSEEDELLYRDKGYSGVKPRTIKNATKKQGQLSIKEKLRDYRITKKRAEGEHPYGTIHSAMNGGKSKLTTVARVYIQQLFVCVGYNLRRLTYLVRA